MSYLSNDVINMVKSGRCTISMRVEALQNGQKIESRSIEVSADEIENTEVMANDLLKELVPSTEEETLLFHVVLTQNFNDPSLDSKILREKIRFIIAERNL